MQIVGRRECWFQVRGFQLVVTPLNQLAEMEEWGRTQSFTTLYKFKVYVFPASSLPNLKFSSDKGILSMNSSDFDITVARSKFPALNQPQVFFDNAGGSQTLGTVIES
jgi:hypothetical protein